MLHIPLTLYLLLIKILGIIALFWGTNSTFAAVTKTNYHYLTMKFRILLFLCGCGNKRHFLEKDRE